MKQRYILALSYLIFASIPLVAKFLTPEESLQRVKSHKGIARKSSIIKSTNLLISTGHTEEGQPTWYAFNNDNSGWMILSASDNAAPLLAYSETGNFDPVNMPEGLKWWLNQYSVQISNSNKSLSVSTYEDVKSSIPPMIQTTWDQNSPFNIYTPEIGGVHTPTGCVATSMAQLMKFHSYPEQGKGKLSYIMQGTNLSLDLDSFKFAWSEMTNNYFHNPTNTQIEAVAKLMQACGYAVESIYNSQATDAQVYQWPRALIENFGYAPSSDLISRIYYTDTDWENTIYNSLANGYPVLYSGLGTSGGHAFICDGYAGNGFYHFNWGWAGLSDGYFLLSALNPTALGTGGGAGGFNSGQIAVVNCRPNFEGSVMTPKMGLLENSEITYSNVSKNFSLMGGIMNLSPGVINAKVGFEVTTMDGNHLYAGEANNTIEFPLQNILQSYARKLSATLEDGTYQVRPVFGIEKDNSIEWHRVLIPVNRAQYWTLKFEGGKGEIIKSTINSDVKTSDLRATTGIYVSSQFKVEAKIENLSEFEFMSDVYVLLYNKNGEVTYYSDANPVDIMGKTTSTVEFTCLPKNLIKSGEWELGLGLLIDKQTKQFAPISDRVTVTVKPYQSEIKMEATNFRVLDENNVDPESLTLAMNLKCVKGHYANPLRIWIRPKGAEGTWGQMIQTQYIYMEEDETREITYTFCYPKGIPGTQYDLTSNYVIPSSQSWLGTCSFRIAGGSGVAQTSTNDENVRWYNLQGIQCEPSSPGLYIKLTNGKSEKVLIK